jgi:hypothetical protein
VVLGERNGVEAVFLRQNFSTTLRNEVKRANIPICVSEPAAVTPFHGSVVAADLH